MRKSTLWSCACATYVLVAGCERNEPPSVPDNAEHAETRSALQTPEPRVTAASSKPAPEPRTQPESAAAEPKKAERKPDVAYVPTPQPVVEKMLELAKVKQSDIVYDLGCGDGRIVVTAAKEYGARAFGFDIDPRRVEEARENARRNNVEHLVTIEQKDIFTLDLSPADVVTLYLLPKLNVRLIPQLEKLRPGSRIVSHDFAMEGVTPTRHVMMKMLDEEKNHDIYLWHTPLKKETAAKRADR